MEVWSCSVVLMHNVRYRLTAVSLFSPLSFERLVLSSDLPYINAAAAEPGHANDENADNIFISKIELLHIGGGEIKIPPIRDTDLTCNKKIQNGAAWQSICKCNRR